MINKVKDWFLSKSIKFKYLSSYLLIALFSVTILTIVYAYLYNNAEKHALKSNELILNSIKKDVDALFLNINSLYYKVLTNQKLLALNEMEPSSVDYAYQIYEFRNNLSVVDDNRYGGLDYYIYLKNGDNIIDKASTIGLKQYYENYVKASFVYDGYEAWHGDFFGNAGGVSRKGKSRDAFGNISEFISFVYPVPFSRTTQPAIYLVVSVSEDVLLGPYKKELNMENFSVFIRDRQGGFLLATGDTSKIALSDAPAPLKAATSYNRGIVTTSVLSQNEEYTYIVQSNKGVFQNEVYPITGFIILSFMVYIAALFGLIRFLLHANYNPIKELISLFGNSFQNNIHQDSNEFNVMKSVILDTAEKLKRTETDIKLKSFLSGEASPRNIDELFQNGLEFSCCQYIVALFKKGELSRFYANENLDERLKSESANQIIFNVLEDVLVREFKTVKIIKTDGELAAVIMTGGSDYKRPFEFAAEFAKQFIGENFSFGFTVVVSGMYTDIKDLPKAYLQALSALEYSLLIGKDTIIYADSYKGADKRENTEYYFSKDFEDELVNAAQEGNCIYAKELIKQFFRTNFYRDYIDINFMQLALCDLLAALLKTVRENRSCYGEIAGQVANCVNKFRKNDVSVDELSEMVYNIVDNICENSGGYHVVKSISNIMSIVEQEYSNPDLCNDVIAERLGVGANYVSRLFKKHTGANLHEYIQTKRVDKAKELLLKFDMTNEEIADRAGLGNTRNLLRMFRKYVGDTPMRYRMKARKTTGNREE